MKRPFFITTILLITVIFVGIWVVSGNADITNETLVGNEQDEPASDKEELITDRDEVIQDDEEIIENQEKPTEEILIQDEVEIFDEIGNNVEQPLNEEMVARFDRKNSVDMGVVYSNLLGDNEEYIVFKIALNNHLINLENFKYDELASLSFGNGNTINDGFIWESTSQGHHVSGLLKLPKDNLGINTSISELGSAQLEFEGIGGPEKMIFKWEKDFVDLYTK